MIGNLSRSGSVNSCVEPGEQSDRIGATRRFRTEIHRGPPWSRTREACAAAESAVTNVGVSGSWTGAHTPLLIRTPPSSTDVKNSCEPGNSLRAEPTLGIDKRGDDYHGVFLALGVLGNRLPARLC